MTSLADEPVTRVAAAAFCRDLHGRQHPAPPCGACWGRGFAVAEELGNLPSVAKPPMVMRSIRVPIKLWEAAKSRANEREEDLSEAIRRFLERYAR